MGSKQVLIERVVNGGRNVRYAEAVPEDMEFVVTETDAVVDEATGVTEPPHIHITFGSADDLKGVGLKKSATATKK